MEAHEVLGIAPDATRAEVTAAYRRRVMEIHPDRHPDADALERRRRADETARLNAAYALLRRAAEENEDEIAVEEEPVDEGVEPLRPPRRRRRAVSILVVGLLACATLVALWLPATGGSTPGLAPGRCVAWMNGYSVVPCGVAHAGRVSVVVDSISKCPAGGYTRHAGKVYCIDVGS